ncbi:hypothetical protein MTO96_010547 [Rhipicephalus appendiculatus]
MFALRNASERTPPPRADRIKRKKSLCGELQKDGNAHARVIDAPSTQTSERSCFVQIASPGRRCAVRKRERTSLQTLASLSRSVLTTLTPERTYDAARWRNEMARRRRLREEESCFRGTVSLDEPQPSVLKTTPTTM